jgi:hypothetical protein
MKCPKCGTVGAMSKPPSDCPICNPAKKPIVIQKDPLKALKNQYVAPKTSRNNSLPGLLVLSILAVAVITVFVIAMTRKEHSNGMASPVQHKKTYQVILDVPELFNSSIQAIEEQYGPSKYHHQVNPGVMMNFPQGGEDRTYERPFLSTMFFDRAQQLCGIMLIDFGKRADDNSYAWLQEFGISLPPSPDEQYPGRITWYRHVGLQIDMLRDPQTAQIGQINIWKK